VVRALKCRRGPWVSSLVPMSTRLPRPSIAPTGMVLMLVGDEGESRFGPDAVLRWVRPLVHFAVCVWRFLPQRVTRFRLLLVCGFAADDLIFSQLSFGESTPTPALGFCSTTKCAFCSL